MKSSLVLAAAVLLGLLALAGCSGHQTHPTAAPPAASLQVMQQKAAQRAQNDAAAQAAIRQHMQQTSPPS